MGVLIRILWYFPVQPSHSANKYVFLDVHIIQTYFNLRTLGSPCNTKVGLERRTFVFKHTIQILNDGDLSNKVCFLCH